MFKYIFSLLRPKNAEQAATMKYRLSIAYAILGWNAFILMFYKVMTRDLPTDSDERKLAIISKLSNTKNIQLMRIDGLSVVEQRNINADDLKEEIELQQSMKE